MSYLERIAGSLSVAGFFLLFVLSTAQMEILQLGNRVANVAFEEVPAKLGEQMWSYHYFFQFGHLFFLAIAILASLLMLRKLPPLLPGLPEDAFREEEDAWNA